MHSGHHGRGHYKVQESNDRRQNRRTRNQTRINVGQHGRSKLTFTPKGDPSGLKTENFKLDISNGALLTGVEQLMIDRLAAATLTTQHALQKKTTRLKPQKLAPDSQSPCVLVYGLMFALLWLFFFACLFLFFIKLLFCDWWFCTIMVFLWFLLFRFVSPSLCVCVCVCECVCAFVSFSPCQSVCCL